MRVIGGEFRSRLLKTLPGLDTRPTPDRLREALFNVLAPEIAGTVFLDAYAGTGAVGIEALSRGAARAVFIERGRAAVDIIRQNLDSLGLRDRAEVIQGRAVAWLAHRTADIIFLDPPYRLEADYGESLRILGESAAGLVVVQHWRRFDPGAEHGALRRVRVLTHGDNSLSFYRPA